MAKREDTTTGLLMQLIALALTWHGDESQQQQHLVQRLFVAAQHERTSAQAEIERLRDVTAFSKNAHRRIEDAIGVRIAFAGRSSRQGAETPRVSRGI